MTSTFNPTALNEAIRQSRPQNEQIFGDLANKLQMDREASKKNFDASTNALFKQIDGVVSRARNADMKGMKAERQKVENLISGLKSTGLHNDQIDLVHEQFNEVLGSLKTSTTTSKQVLSSISESVTQQAGDMMALMGGMLSDSPMVALGIKFASDKIRGMSEERRLAKAQSVEQLQAVKDALDAPDSTTDTPEALMAPDSAETTPASIFQRIADTVLDTNDRTGNLESYTMGTETILDGIHDIMSTQNMADIEQAREAKRDQERMIDALENLEITPEAQTDDESPGTLWGALAGLLGAGVGSIGAFFTSKVLPKVKGLKTFGTLLGKVAWPITAIMSVGNGVWTAIDEAKARGDFVDVMASFVGGVTEIVSLGFLQVDDVKKAADNGVRSIMTGIISLFEDGLSWEAFSDISSGMAHTLATPVDMAAKFTSRFSGWMAGVFGFDDIEAKLNDQAANFSLVDTFKTIITSFLGDMGAIKAVNLLYEQATSMVRSFMSGTADFLGINMKGNVQQPEVRVPSSSLRFNKQRADDITKLSMEVHLMKTMPDTPANQNLNINKTNVQHQQQNFTVKMDPRDRFRKSSDKAIISP